MKVHFSLRKQGSSDPIIVLNAFDSRLPDRKLIYSTGQAINPSKWKKSAPKKANRGKSTIGFPKDEAELLPLREHLNNLRNAAEAWANKHISRQVLDRKDLHSHLDRVGVEEQQQEAEQIKNETEFFEIWKKIIDTTKHPKTGKPVTELTKRHKLQTLTKVSEYCAARKFKPTLQNIDLNFYHDFDYWMQKELVTRTGEIGLDDNTRGRHFKELKAFLSECVERDYPNVNMSFKKKDFRVIKSDVDSIYLTKPEIQALINLDYDNGKAELRAHYVTACFTGLRHSDWWQHDPANIVEHDGRQLFKIKVQKTGEWVYIPLHPVVKNYLNQYGRLKSISNQKMNEYAKEFVTDAKAKKENKNLFKDSTQYSCHTTRRTFCTLAYLSQSIPTHTIMKISGHKTEASFLKYLKIGSLDHAIIAAASDFFTDESFKTLKIA